MPQNNSQKKDKKYHKNFLYTAIVTGILTILVLGYFIFMLPSLYVDYTANENYNAIVEQHNRYLEDLTYENVVAKNPSCMSIDIPFANNSIVVTGKTFQTTITPKTPEMEALLSEIKTYFKEQITSFQNKDGNLSTNGFTSEFEEKATEWKDAFLSQVTFLDTMPFDLKTKSDIEAFNQNWEESSKIYYLNDNTIIMEAGVEDGDNHYTIYFGLTFTSEHVVLSYLPAMTPSMNQITPIVVRSLPMLIAVIVLFALVVSHLYSKGIVDPIIKLVKHTEAVKLSGNIKNAALPVKGKDEIATLIQTLNHLYEELDQNYNAMEHKNQELNEKNKSQEVFLRSSSHQLKTPISAALLLVDRMINRIGKYQETDTYLPEVKKQLLSMRKIVEDILYLSRCEESITMELVDITTLFDRQLSYYQIMLAEHKFQLVKEYSENSVVMTDSSLLLKVFDNLITNAIVHSKEGATITLVTKANQFEIHNSNAHINEELMPNIFEPFVSGNGSGHGLGLYIVNYYANKLAAKISVNNEKDGVMVKIVFPSPTH
jgi:signal transduction histidine kinase